MDNTGKLKITASGTPVLKLDSQNFPSQAFDFIQLENSNGSIPLQIDNRGRIRTAGGIEFFGLYNKIIIPANGTFEICDTSGRKYMIIDPKNPGIANSLSMIQGMIGPGSSGPNYIKDFVDTEITRIRTEIQGAVDLALPGIQKYIDADIQQTLHGSVKDMIQDTIRELNPEATIIDKIRGYIDLRLDTPETAKCLMSLVRDEWKIVESQIYETLYQKLSVSPRPDEAVEELRTHIRNCNETLRELPE